MSRIISLVFALTMVVLAESADRGYIVKIGDSSPDFSLTMLDGKIVSLKDLKGKIVVLQFTASWCSVCRIEMPHLEKEVWQRFKDQDFVLIGIDRDEPLDVVKKFKQEMKVTYPMALDPGSDIFALFAHKNAGVTRNIVLDRNGEIVFLTRLFEKQEFNQMIEKIEKLLAVDKKS
ncbi:MAG: TlpA disulfide reductase family protein [Candidatus Marinimicrobia bacterium]|nr:TlpA disulfide reductase family protein [Candidatus Neomarinimicrobiota bacterium]MDP6789937.1 TlpA disulfide reductase family protein [Candidatus Neomarinimicrobiota bacterium]MDP7071690.1 TlpA disulfide reductase family protein [Candidatus Neomarinimicrobiota bacterium]